MMVAAATRSQVLLAQVVIVLMVALIALGLVWYGISTDVYRRAWNDIAARPGGPMTFRFVLQPLMAAFAALHDAVADVQSGSAPYLQTIVANSAERASRLREGLIATARIILLGIAMDTIYQFTVLKAFYPGETVIVAFLLAFVPYLLLRGPLARVVRWWFARNSAGPAT